MPGRPREIESSCRFEPLGLDQGVKRGPADGQHSQRLFDAVGCLQEAILMRMHLGTIVMCYDGSLLYSCDEIRQQVI